MKNYSPIVKAFLMLLIICSSLYAAGANYLADAFSTDTIKDKEFKKLERMAERDKLRNSHSRYGIRFGYVYAFLDTEVSFELPNRNLSSNLSLEKNLGLPSNSYFFTGSFLYRFTPRSGAYAHYYGINREDHSQTDQDYIFKRDTIPEGTNVNVHFNTQVISVGYLYSVLRDPNAFLGFYFNIYFMYMETGVKSDHNAINSDVKLIAPLPNIGLLASFRLTHWLNLNGGVGFFSLNTSDFGGSLYNFDISLMTRPIKWLGVSLSYQEFDVRVRFPADEINTVVDYNFRGPALAVSFIF